MMKYATIFSCIVFLFSCVPLKDYNQKVAELNELNVGNKDLRKQIRQLDKENTVWLDTIHKRVNRANVLRESIQKRLADTKVRGQIDASKLLGISVHEPNKDEYAMRWISEHKNADTNSAKSTLWLSTREKNIYYYLNWARLNPKDFCNRFVVPKLRYDSSNIYLLTLVDYMYSMPAMPALKPNKIQFQNAHCHAVSSGKRGYVGHSRTGEECRGTFMGECCSYGCDDPLKVVLQLLIDDGTPSLGHRYICLGFYSEVGIAYAPHSAWGSNVVLDFI